MKEAGYKVGIHLEKSRVFVYSTSTSVLRSLLMSSTRMAPLYRPEILVFFDSNLLHSYMAPSEVLLVKQIQKMLKG